MNKDWNTGWLDVTYPIFEGSVGWPGQPPIKFEPLSHIHCGDQARVTVAHFSVHSNTHMDAPNHFMAEGIDISQFPIEVGMGPTRIAHVHPEKEITPADIEAYEKRTRPIEAGERIVFRSQNSDRFWPSEPFDYAYIGIGPEAAEWLAKRKVMLAGVDYLSVGQYDTTPLTHRSLLTANIWIIEGLDLRKIEEGDYEMICLPLKLTGCDGSPIRVLLKPVG